MTTSTQGSIPPAFNKEQLIPDFLERGAETLAKELSAADISSHQVRRIFSTIKRLEAAVRRHGWSNEAELKARMLIPLVTYSAGRDIGNMSGKDKDKKQRKEHAWKKLISLCSQAVHYLLSSNDKKKAMDEVVMAFEAVVAYHTYTEKLSGKNTSGERR